MSSEYRLDIGGVVIGLLCRQPDFAVGLANWFGAPSAPAEPHIVLEMEIVPHDDSPHLPRSLLTTKTVDGAGGFDIADGLIRGSYDATAGRGEILAKAALLGGRLPRILEQVFYQAWHSARAVAGVEAWLVHSSAVIAEGRGYLFVGPSEAGKSTVARLSSAYHVLGDEMNVVVPGPGGLDVAGTVFNGTFRAKRPGRAPLAAVLLLEHASRHLITPDGSAAAVSALAAEIVPPVGLDRAPDAGTLPAMVDAAAAIAGKSALKRMEFLPDAGFWKPLLADTEAPPRAS